MFYEFGEGYSNDEDQDSSGSRRRIITIVLPSGKARDGNGMDDRKRSGYTVGAFNTAGYCSLCQRQSQKCSKTW